MLDYNVIREKGVPTITGFVVKEDEKENKSINITPIIKETTNATQPLINNSIEINLQYKKDSIYDVDNDGIEDINNAIDFTAENTKFNWNVDKSKLCTRWEVYSINEAKATTLCYGNNNCCNFINLESSR